MTEKIYKILPEKAFELYKKNEEFRNTLISGNFLYIENSYILKTPEYIHETESGICDVTDYARNNLSECAITFDDKLIYKYSGSTTRGDSTRRAKIEKKNVIEYSNNNQHDKFFEAVNEAKEALEIAEKLPNTFAPALDTLIKWRKVTNEKLAEKTLMSSRTIQRLRTEPAVSYKPGTIVAICVGLQLFPRISQRVMEMAGITLKNTKRDFIYSHILSTQYKNSIHECNDFLVAAKLKPLIKKDDSCKK